MLPIAVRLISPVRLLPYRGCTLLRAMLSLTLLLRCARWAAFSAGAHRLMAGYSSCRGHAPHQRDGGQFTAAFTLICAFYIGSVIAEPAHDLTQRVARGRRAQREAIWALAVWD